MIRAFIILLGIATVVLSKALPWKRVDIHNPYPLPNGFPTPNPQQIEAISEQAHGQLPNLDPGLKISSTGATILQALRAVETAEAAFWYQLQYNISTCQPGYEVPSYIDQDDLLTFVNQSLAVESLHSLSLQEAIGHFNVTDITPCTDYNFPVDNLYDALHFQAIHSANSLATLGDCSVRIATAGDIGPTQLFLNVAGSEGEQAAQLRKYINKTAIDLPFPTYGYLDFTYSVVQSWVGDSCPNINSINLTTYGAIDVLDNPGAADQEVRYSLSKDKWKQGSNYTVVYFNSARVPITETSCYVSEDDDHVIIKANFPYSENELNGLVIVSVTDQPGPWKNVAEAAQVAVWAPGFILAN